MNLSSGDTGRVLSYRWLIFAVLTTAYFLVYFHRLSLSVVAAIWLLALMTARFGWRPSFEVIGGATFVLLILVWLIVRDRPQDKGWPGLAEIDGEVHFFHA